MVPYYRSDPTHEEIRGSTGHRALHHMLFPWKEVGGARMIEMQKLKKLRLQPTKNIASGYRSRT